MKIVEFLFRKGGPFELSIGIVGAILLFFLVGLIVSYISMKIKARKREAKKSIISGNIKKEQDTRKRSVRPPSGAKVYLFDKDGRIVHESRTKLTRTEIRNLGGEGTVIAMNEKIARWKWERAFGKPTL